MSVDEDAVDALAQAIVDGFAEHASGGAYIEALGDGFVLYNRCTVLMQDVARHVLTTLPPGLLESPQ